MKVLIVRGNPRKTGVCETLADAFSRGAKNAGADVLDFDASDKNILMCKGCFCCTAKNKCLIDDPLTALSPILSQSDAIVCVSPLYFFSMSAQMKRFFDRAFPFINGYEFAQTDGSKNKTSFEIKNKKFLAITAALGRDPNAFDVLTKTYEKICKSLDFEFCGHIARGESAYFGELGVKSVRIKKIIATFENAGAEFVNTKNISSETLKNLSAPIAESDKIFNRRAKIFWEILKKH